MGGDRRVEGGLVENIDEAERVRREIREDRRRTFERIFRRHLRENPRALAIKLVAREVCFSESLVYKVLDGTR